MFKRVLDLPVRRRPATPCSSPPSSTPLGFVGNFAVPMTMDGAPRWSTGKALLIDLGLLGIFALQHSVMARPFFKRWLTRFIPEPPSAAPTCCCRALALIALFAFWQPLGGVVWNMQRSDAARRALRRCSPSAGCWCWCRRSSSTTSTCSACARCGCSCVGRPYTPLKFGTPGPYKLVRHPLYLGWLFAFWATPTMTGTHLLFAFMTTAYILVAIQLEERDLVDALGDDYRRYRERVPMILPLGRSAAGGKGRAYEA